MAWRVWVEMTQPYAGALPRPTPETQPFWDGARQHRLMLPWCTACNRPHFYPRALCPFCLCQALDWRAASGRGRLHTYVINHKPAKGFTAPYVIAVVELDEGVRMLSNLVMDGAPTPERLAIDMPVTVVFDDVTDAITLPKFAPVVGDAP
jgi:uncharacterized protein